MSGIARTNATGAGGMLPELVLWSSSFELDREIVREDLLGSAAHVTMLGRAGIIPGEDARALRDALRVMHDEARAGTLALAEDEEDVHMAVEAELTRRLGAVAARLHTARSRNDQVALDLRLHVREHASATLRDAAALAVALADRAAREKETLLPAYTHRQRAQPISAAFLVASWAVGLLRAADTVAYALDRLEMPLGSGACSGTSLPIDRDLVARLLAMPVTANALDTVGDRGFALDWTWSAARLLLALGKIAADVVDYSTREFALVTLDDEIATGSSMMPQKKNADVFELVRAKSARGIGNVVQLLALVKGLPSGYNRDQQEDRVALLDAAPLVRGALRAIGLAMPHIHFEAHTGRAALDDGATQATDLAEALVRRGVAFRDAYKAVGVLVREASDAGVALRAITLAQAQRAHAAFDASTLASLDPATAVAAKESAGGTGPRAVDAQIAHVRARAATLAESAGRHPSLDDLATRIFAEPLGG